MYNRLIEFVKKNDILYSCQFGFRKTHSTSLASIHLINNIASAIDRHETTAGVFLDLSKAFDTTDHQILFGKLEHYGICGWAWLGSYFSCRQQLVQFNCTCSSKQTILSHHPQCRDPMRLHHPIPEVNACPFPASIENMFEFISSKYQKKSDFFFH